MLGHPPIFLIQHIQRLPIESEIRIIDAVRQFPTFGIQVDFSVGGMAGDDVGDEDIILVLSAA